MKSPTAVFSQVFLCKFSQVVLNDTLFYIYRKTIKVVVDHVKIVIKSGKKHTSQEKLRSLVLLNKCLIKAAANEEFVAYVGKKIMDRLKIMAAYTPSKDVPVSDKSNLAVRGAKIFLPDEPDELHAAKFLMMLLQYIK